MAYIPKYQIIFSFFLITSVSCPSLFFPSVSVLVCLSVCVCMGYDVLAKARGRGWCAGAKFFLHHVGPRDSTQVVGFVHERLTHRAISLALLFFCFPTASGTSLMAKASIHALSSPVYNVAAPYRLVEWMMNGWVMGFILSVIFPSFLN